MSLCRCYTRLCREAPSTNGESYLSCQMSPHNGHVGRYLGCPPKPPLPLRPHSRWHTCPMEWLALFDQHLLWIRWQMAHRSFPQESHHGDDHCCSSVRQWRITSLHPFGRMDCALLQGGCGRLALPGNSQLLQFDELGVCHCITSP